MGELMDGVMYFDSFAHLPGQKIYSFARNNVITKIYVILALTLL